MDFDEIKGEKHLRGEGLDVQHMKKLKLVMKVNGLLRTYAQVTTWLYLLQHMNHFG